MKLRSIGCGIEGHGGPALHDGGGARFLSYQRVAPIPRPPWYSKRSYDSTPNVLNAALGRVRFPAVGVTGFKSVPLVRRVIRTFAGMYTYVLMGDLLSSGVQVARPTAG